MRRLRVVSVDLYIVIFLFPSDKYYTRREGDAGKLMEGRWREGKSK